MTDARELHSTGVPGLDLILGGGLPARQAIVVTGNPGTGKTLLCSQIAFAFAARGEPVVIATVTSEPHDKLIQELSGFEFFDRDRVGEEALFLSIYPWLKKSAAEAREVLLTTVRERRAKLLFIDGLRALRDLWQDESMLREFMYELSVGLAAAGCTGLFSTEYELDRLMALPEATTVDGIIALSVERRGAARHRKAEVVKLRGRAHLAGDHRLRISRRGLEVTPRLEARTEPDPEFTPSGGRAPFGVAELDALLSGGLPRESSTLIVGSTGIGKTLLSMRFLCAAASAGERAVFVSFFEPSRPLVARAKAVGCDVEPALVDGSLLIDYCAPLDLDADELVDRILSRVSALDARRLVIDGMAELERAIGAADRTREFLSALMIELRRRRVTTIFTREVSKLASSDVDFSESPTSLIAENLLFLRHVELRGRIRRILSILKMRASDYDANVREFQITDAGFVVLEPMREAAGLLTGVARPHASAE